MEMRFRLNVLVAVVVAISVTVLSVAVERPASKSAASVSDANTVARIGDYTITKDQLKQRWLQEIQPKRESPVQPGEPVGAEVVIRKMLAEKAMSMEGRKLGFLEDEGVLASTGRYKTRQLTQLLLSDFVRKNVKVTDEEIAAQMAADPNVTRERAEMLVQRTKARPMLEEYYKNLLTNLKLKKVPDNFARAAEIHQRLLLKPAVPRNRGMYWITSNQMKTELSDEEKNLVLATFTGGQVTLYDWFKTLGDMAPPGRPKDLNTPEGVDKLLDRALAPAILVAKAVAEGYDKNPEYLEGLRELEDRVLMGKLRSDKMQEAKEPTEAEIKAYYDKAPEVFATMAMLKVEQIWCEGLEAAQKAKAAIEGGESFESVEKANAPEGKSRGSHSVYPTSEGLFWDTLWKADPNSLVGPIKGFYAGAVKWRLVKVNEKKEPEVRPWSDSIKGQVKAAIMTERREALMETLEQELLKKYSHTIYPEHFKGLDPLEVTPAAAQAP